MKKKALLIAAAAAAFVFAAPITAEAATPGWNQVNGQWLYADKDGSYVSGEWVDNNQYYIGGDGIMVSDTTYRTIKEIETEKDGVTTYTYENGYHVFDEKGHVITTAGWAHVGENWYWVNEKGFAGLVNDKYDATKYYDSLSKAGWVLDGGKWYYINEDGSMRIGKVQICDNPDEKDSSKQTYTYYWLGRDGAMVTGWYNYAPETTYGSWVYCNEDGKAYDGWLLYGGKWYYLNQGSMVADGTYNTGKYENNGPGSSGNPDWKKDPTAPNKQNYIVNGKYDWDAYNDAVKAYRKAHNYVFDKTGALVSGWYHCEFTDNLGVYTDSWYYAEPSTGLAWDGWLLDNGKWYYISDGHMMRQTTFYDSANAPKAPEYPYPSSSDYCTKWNEELKTYEIDQEAYDAARKKYSENYEELWQSYYIACANNEDVSKEYRNCHTYIFDKDGAMVIGWYSMTTSNGTTWYYADGNGVARTGWLLDGGKWYYIQHGEMLTNQYTPDGYYVDANGVCK